MEDIENILRKIKDLMNSKPKTLDFLIDEKNKKIKSISALKESVSNNNLKKYTIEKEKETLNREKTILLGLLNIAKNEDIEFIVKTLNLSLDVDHDLYALHNYFPLQIKIRQDIINELAKLIKDDLDKLDNINKEINELDIKYKSISTNQFKLVKLIKRVLNKDTSITRDEVLSILKSVAFDEEESYVAAKLILFPERELIPYFEGFNIEFKEPTEQIIDISYSDTVKKDKELENEDTSLEEDIKEEPIYENNILVSLDQMRSLIENNMNEMYKKKSLKKKQKDNRNILEQIGKNKSDLSLFEGVSFNIDHPRIPPKERRRCTSFQKAADACVEINRSNIKRGKHPFLWLQQKHRIDHPCRHDPRESGAQELFKQLHHRLALPVCLDPGTHAVRQAEDKLAVFAEHTVIIPGDTLLLLGDASHTVENLEFHILLKQHRLVFSA